jgi:ABC-2 type transport system ATP-binding protein
VASRTIRNMLADYVRRGSTVFLTSHVLDVVEKLCTHVGIIAGGKLVEQASLDEIRRGGSLEERFLQRVGANAEAAAKLSWLEEAPA